MALDFFGNNFFTNYVPSENQSWKHQEVWQLIFTYIALYPELTSSNILFDKHPTVLTDMLMLKWLGFTKQDSSIMDKPHSLNVAAKAKHIKNRGKKGVGATKTLAMMMGAHPAPSARESISPFWTFNRCHRFKPFYGFDRAVHVVQLYYGLANLLKVCVSNLILDTSNLRYRKLYIVYKVDLGWGLVSKP